MEFAVYVLDRNENEHAFLKNIFFSDKAIIHVSGLLNKYKWRTWGSLHSHESREMESK